MALQAVYERFLTAPNPLSLTENASLHYVTTLTSYLESGPIIRHLEKQNRNEVKIKSAKVISAVEGPNALAVEVETSLEFLSSGGSYLPGLDNFIIDRVATLPLAHMVTFEQDNRIKQIRVSWDQGSLLKQLDVIGSRGKNWPIVDGKEQIRLITNTAVAKSAPESSIPTSPRGRGSQENGFGSRNTSPSKRHVKDPHASLDLFEPIKHDENQKYTSGTAIAPRMSAKPPPREMSELFAAGHEDYEPSEQNGGSPKKIVDTKTIAPKAGGSHKFQPSRLFDEEPELETALAYKSHPAKYNHFDIGDELENDPLQRKASTSTQNSQVPLRPKTNKHQSQWDFEDFMTPHKIKQKVRGQDVVHINWNQDETPKGNTIEAPPAAAKSRRENGSQFELRDDGTPVNREAAVPKTRKDAQTHFEFGDDSTPVSKRIIGRPAAAASGLYQDNVHRDEDDGTQREKAPLSTITNNTGRRHDFGSHWEMHDSSPAPDFVKNENNIVVTDGKKANQTMDAQWSSHDDSPNQANRPVSKGQPRKGTESQWRFGNDAEDSSMPNNRAAPKSFWDF